MAKKTKSKSKAECTVESRGGKCILYTKNHKLKKAAKAHMTAINKRGGKVKLKESAGLYKLEYTFTNKKIKSNVSR